MMQPIPILVGTFATLAITCTVTHADHPTLAFGSGVAGPAITIPATTLPKGRGAAAVRVEYVKFSPVPDAVLISSAARGEDVHSVDYLVSPSLSAGYGFTDDFTVGLRLPYLIRVGIKEAHQEDGDLEIHSHGDSDGIGDLTLLGQYRFFKAERGPEIALLAGLKMPTGATDVKDGNGELFEVEHQPGSGSWDPIIGVAATKRFGAASLDANVLYTFATGGAQSTNLGDRFYYNLALSYVLPSGDHHHEESAEHHHDEEAAEHRHDEEAAEHRHGQPGHTEWHLILELNGEWQEKQKIAGEVDGNSGGSLIYLSPGVRWCGPRAWAATLSVGIPVFEDRNGVQHETDVRTVLAIGKGF